MNLIQSYFNKAITYNNINYAGGYMSASINWLSMAYSCLLLKQHNPTDNLIFYGNESMVRILGDLFQLPYDDYKIIDIKDEFSEWFYCWPKILTYELQQSPFIHIDTDIFMWDTIPTFLRNAPLIAQHLEKDSTFYFTVNEQMKKDGIFFPNFMEDCFKHDFINSYNAGLFGGNDLSFFQEYVLEIRKFLDINKRKISLSDRKFLYNVVFEQWLFYGLSNKYHIPVSTFYKKPIMNFNMGKAHVPLQISSLNKLTYMHVMEYKKNKACNYFIAYKMLSEFPEIYHRIVSICKRKGIESDLYFIASPKNTINFTSGSIRDSNWNSKVIPIRDDIEYNKKEVDDIETLNIYRENRGELIKLQEEHNELIESIRKGTLSRTPLNLLLNPLLQISEPSDYVLRKYIKKGETGSVADWVLLKLYNPIFNTIDRFLWTKQRYNFLLSLLNEKTLRDIITSEVSLSKSLQKVREFITQSLFDGIIIVKS